MSRAQKYGPWAVITGASDGIGRAIAHRLADEGINVVLVARREPALQQLADEIGRASRVQTRVLTVDLGTADGPAILMAAVADLDIGLAVLAAGFGGAGSFADSSPSAEAEMVAVNVSAVAQLAQHFAHRMAQRGTGGLVLFGSLLGWQGVPGQSNYAATKAYVQALGEGLHAELKPLGVDVLCVAPGPVHSGFADRAGMTMASATTPEVVASGVWAALGRQKTVIPGAQGKFMTASLKTLPRPARTAILARVMESMRNGDGH
jgi:short-subunit dehydrogenase